MDGWTGGGVKGVSGIPDLDSQKGLTQLGFLQDSDLDLDSLLKVFYFVALFITFSNLTHIVPNPAGHRGPVV